jgi:hypothetical protein
LSSTPKIVSNGMCQQPWIQMTGTHSACNLLETLAKADRFCIKSHWHCRSPQDAQPRHPHSPVTLHADPEADLPRFQIRSSASWPLIIAPYLSCFSIAAGVKICATQGDIPRTRVRQTCYNKQLMWCVICLLLFCIQESALPIVPAENHYLP